MLLFPGVFDSFQNELTPSRGGTAAGVPRQIGKRTHGLEGPMPRIGLASRLAIVSGQACGTVALLPV
jgi:hypothetical protein